MVSSGLCSPVWHRSLLAGGLWDRMSEGRPCVLVRVLYLTPRVDFRSRDSWERVCVSDNPKEVVTESALPKPAVVCQSELLQEQNYCKNMEDMDFSMLNCFKNRSLLIYSCICFMFYFCSYFTVRIDSELKVFIFTQSLVFIEFSFMSYSFNFYWYDFKSFSPWYLSACLGVFAFCRSSSHDLFADQSQTRVLGRPAGWHVHLFQSISRQQIPCSKKFSSVTA